MKCKNCNNEFSEKYSKWSNGDFCSKSCAMKYSRKSLIIGTKKSKCISCGKEIEIHSMASHKQCKCNDCKKYITYISKNGNKSCKEKRIKCLICGQINCLRPDICKKRKLFYSLSKWFGFDKSKIGTIDVYKEFENSVLKLKEEYFNNKLSLIDISKKYKCNFQTLGELFKSLKIKLRNKSDSVSNSILQGKPRGNTINQYKCGWHTTWNGKQIFYRSSYELDYCKKLDEKKIDYEVEKLRILYWDSQIQKQRVAIPDFYLKNINEIHEVKID